MRSISLRAALGVGVLSLGLLAATAVPAAAEPGLTATFTKTQTWESGFQGQFTIRNGGTGTVPSWRVEFDLPAGTTVGSFWDALITRTGDHYVAVNRDYNGTLSPGASTTFGFVAAGSGSPLNCRINGAACDGSGGDTTPPSVPGNLRTTATSSSSVSLAWNASTDNVGVTGYEVLRGGVPAQTVTGTSATVGGLSPATTYTFTVRAVDAAANRSGASNQVSATTQPGGPGPAPTALPVAPYIDMGAWPEPVLTQIARDSGVRGYTLAFVTAVGGCRASWFNAHDPRTGWQRPEIDALRAQGGDVKISFGGAAGTELAQACTSVASLAAEYQAVVDAYALTHIDLDIEGAAVADRASVDRRSAALAQVQRSRPGLRVSLTLPVLPDGLTADGVNVVRSARDAGVNLDVLNVMAMDYYQGGDMGDKAIQAARSTFAQLRTLYPGRGDAALWRMVGVTPMIGHNDSFNARGEQFLQSDARDLVAFAGQQHLGVLAFWEVTRDRNACTGPLFRCTNVPQQPYEFSRIFNGFTG